jgi:hypothetical protein
MQSSLLASYQKCEGEGIKDKNQILALCLSPLAFNW